MTSEKAKELADEAKGYFRMWTPTEVKGFEAAIASHDAVVTKGVLFELGMSIGGQESRPAHVLKRIEQVEHNRGITGRTQDDSQAKRVQESKEAEKMRQRRSYASEWLSKLDQSAAESVIARFLATLPGPAKEMMCAKPRDWKKSMFFQTWLADELEKEGLV